MPLAFAPAYNAPMDRSFLEKKFEVALPYDSYARTGTDEQHRRWRQVYDVVKPTELQQQLLGQFTREMKLLIVSGIWCGDCVQQCPLIQRLGEANPQKIAVKLLDRDQHKDLSRQCHINAGDRVPVVLFLAEDFELCSVYGDRPLSRYRAIALRQLGAACEIALGAPPQDELADTMADWFAEIERIQLMLRLSPRLRQKHGD